ncbi:MAG: cysteine desulfurase family protein [Hyphomicrobiaceae bacterium]
MTSSGRTYLDYNATALLRPQARAAMLAAIDGDIANASSVHSEGRNARALIDHAREQVGRLVRAKATEVVFTSGATEAANWVLSRPWNTIYSANIEHPAVLQPIKRSKAEHVVLPVDSNGVIECSVAEKIFSDNGAGGNRQLLLVQGANNETGVVQPVSELTAMAAAAGIKVATDAVQAVGKIEVDFAKSGVDMMMVSAHKIGGPVGVGALVIRDGLDLVPFVAGGGQERNRRGGTENVPGIAGFGAAAEAANKDLNKFAELAVWRDRIESYVANVTPEVEVIGKLALRLANTSCLAVSGRRGETSVIKFDLAGVSLSAGSACSSGKTARSQTLDAMGLDDALATSALRISLGWATSEQDITAFEQAWKDIMSQNGEVRDVA